MNSATRPRARDRASFGSADWSWLCRLIRASDTSQGPVEAPVRGQPAFPSRGWNKKFQSSVSEWSTCLPIFLPPEFSHGDADELSEEEVEEGWLGEVMAAVARTRADHGSIRRRSEWNSDLQPSGRSIRLRHFLD